MSVNTPLNDLILEASIDATPERGEVLLAIGAKKKGVEGITVLAEDENKLSKLVTRARSFGRVKRAIFIRTDRAVQFDPIEVTSQEITSEVQFKLQLGVDLRTPTKDDEIALKRMGHAFRDASLPKKGDGLPDNVAGAPEARVRRELENWLKARYRSDADLAQHSDPNWLSAESKKIDGWIALEYGLDARVKLKIWVPNQNVLRPSPIEVKTQAKDSEKPLNFTIRLSAMLDSRDLFSTRALTQSDLESKVRTIADRYVRSHVSLQDYRFSTGWVADLKDEITKELHTFERKLTEYQVFSSAANDYTTGPHSIRAGKAVFEPAGWNDNGDQIEFSCDAQVQISDAAKWEKERGRDQLLKTVDELGVWLQDELQQAVREVLHPIHRDDEGYAKLLSDWTGTSGYRAKIEDNLKHRATDAGLEVQSIIAKPNREEMRLLDGAVIDLKDLSLQSSAEQVTLDFSATAEIKVNSFEDISGILNRSNKPLDEIRDRYILKTLERYVRQISYLEFYKSFESGPWPAKTDPSENGKDRDDGCVGWLRHKLRESLKGNDSAGQGRHSERIDLLDLTLTQSSTKHFEVYERLTKTIPKPVSLKLDIKSPDGERIIDPYEITFSLSLTGLAKDGIANFFRDWEQYSGNMSEYDAVRADCEAELASYFDEDAQENLFFAHRAGAQGKDNCEITISNRLNRYLDRKFGLSGSPVSINVVNKGLTEQVIREERHRLLENQAKSDAQHEVVTDKIETEKSTLIAIRKAKSEKQISDAEHGMDVDGPSALMDGRKSEPTRRLPPKGPKNLEKPDGE